MSNLFKRLIGFLFPYTRLPKDPDDDLRRISGYCPRPDIDCAACEWPDCISLEGQDRKAVCCRAKTKESK